MIGFFSKRPKRIPSNDDTSLIDHLDELRSRIVKAFTHSLLGLIVCIVFSDFIVNEILLRPMLVANPNAKLQNLVPYGQLSLYLQSVLFSAFILGFPLIAYQIWKFIEPGLSEKEKKGTKFIVLFFSLCFFSGIAFGYFVILPVSLNFFQSFGSPHIENIISIDEYMSFFMGTMFTTGIMFELPFVAYILSKIGLLTPKVMQTFRRHAIVVILVIASIVTPSTDAMTMSLVAAPMMLLYELSILISAAVEKSQKKAASLSSE